VVRLQEGRQLAGGFFGVVEMPTDPPTILPKALQGRTTELRFSRVILMGEPGVVRLGAEVQGAGKNGRHRSRSAARANADAVEAQDRRPLQNDNIAYKQFRSTIRKGSERLGRDQRLKLGLIKVHISTTTS